ncbi:uncharacterized protein LOC131877051 [Tigriopus californicus]|uniref:uncharacterized protein LOC131877051 n=1 Tax=Tigriopus californicus TaxID=6832 RepID=UPI0027DA61A1|nr:uncharacterized protein LOC131877051 [Tigriopus californicus]
MLIKSLTQSKCRGFTSSQFIPQFCRLSSEAGEQAANPLEFKHWIHMKDSLFFLGQRRTPWNRQELNPYKVLQPLQAKDLETDPNNFRENLIQDFNEIYHTVKDVGYPEMADQISGVVFMHATLEEDKCSKCMRVIDYLGMMSDTELIQAMQCTTQWPDTIKHSDVIRDLMKKMDSEFLRRAADFEPKTQWEVAIGLSCLHFLSYLKFPFSVLKSAMEQTTLGHETKEEVTILSLLSCACAHQVDSAFIGQWKEIGDHFQDHVVDHFDDYDPVEVGVCLAGLKVISGHRSQALKLKAENRYGFRF